MYISKDTTNNIYIYHRAFKNLAGFAKLSRPPRMSHRVCDGMHSPLDLRDRRSLAGFDRNHFATGAPRR